MISAKALKLDNLAAQHLLVRRDIGASRRENVEMKVWKSGLGKLHSIHAENMRYGLSKASRSTSMQGSRKLGHLGLEWRRKEAI
jgi:hypothetical protein